MEYTYRTSRLVRTNGTLKTPMYAGTGSLRERADAIARRARMWPPNARVQAEEPSALVESCSDSEASPDGDSSSSASPAVDSSSSASPDAGHCASATQAQDFLETNADAGHETMQEMGTAVSSLDSTRESDRYRELACRHAALSEKHARVQAEAAELRVSKVRLEAEIAELHGSLQQLGVHLAFALAPPGEPVLQPGDSTDY